MTDLDRGKEFEPDIYATHEEEFDDFDVDEEEEGGSRAAIVLLIVIGVVLLLGVAYVSYRMGYENGQREASVPRLQASSEGGKVQPENPGGLDKPQESALDENITGEGGDDFAQLLPSEEQVIEVPADGQGQSSAESGAEGEEVPGVDVPITIGVDPDAAGDEPADAPDDSGASGETAAAPEPEPSEPAVPEPETVPAPSASSPSSSGNSSRIMVPKPGGSPDSGSGSVPSPSTPPPSTSPAPAPSNPPSGPAPNPSTSGDYVIQLASLPSQQAAETAWRNTSSKYSDLLDGAFRDIEEADLGERGIFYRLRVGYFGSLSEAKQLCETLKSRGQDCLVKTR